MTTATRALTTGLAPDAKRSSKRNGVPMSADRPSPGILWHQAKGDAARYRELMREHGHILLPGDEGYEQASATLPCGWHPGKSRAEQDRCDITDLLRASCSHCTGRGEEVPEERDRSALGTSFTARYPGSCAWCGDRIREGDTIRRDGGSGYVCEGCAS